MRRIFAFSANKTEKATEKPPLFYQWYLFSRLTVTAATAIRASASVRPAGRAAVCVTARQIVTANTYAAVIVARRTVRRTVRRAIYAIARCAGVVTTVTATAIAAVPTAPKAPVSTTVTAITTVAAVPTVAHADIAVTIAADTLITRIKKSKHTSLLSFSCI